MKRSGPAVYKTHAGAFLSVFLKTVISLRYRKRQGFIYGAYTKRSGPAVYKAHACSMFRFFQLSKTAAVLALALVLLLPPKTALLEVLIPDGAGSLFVIHQ
jgi:hypothetical protein